MNNNNNNYNSLFKNIYDINKGIPELVYSDFKYKKKDKKLYINNDFFKDKRGIIIFYAPWCIHCKTLAQLMFELAAEYVNLFYFGAVNIENSEDKNDILRIYANVTTIPKVMYINDDYSLSEYKYPLTEDNLIYFISLYQS